MRKIKLEEEKKAVRKGRQNPPPEPEPTPEPDVPEADKYINRHNGKPTNSRMILIASDKPQNFGISSRTDKTDNLIAWHRQHF